MREKIRKKKLARFYPCFLRFIPIYSDVSLFTTGETVEEEFEDGVTEQYSILFISAGVCVVVFIIFLSVLCYRLVHSVSEVIPFSLSKNSYSMFSLSNV